MAFRALSFPRLLSTVFIPFCLCLLFSCGKSARKPAISEEKMVEIWEEIFTAQAYISRHFREFETPADTTATYADNIILHYGYTLAEYDSAMYFYSRNPRRFEKMIEQTITHLSYKEQTAMRADSLIRVSRVSESIRMQDSTRYLDSIQRADFRPRGRGQSSLAVPQLYSGEMRSMEYHQRFLSDWFRKTRKRIREE